MQIEHKVGDKLYLDFGGDKLCIIERQTGEVQQVEMFIEILGAGQLSNNNFLRK